VTLTVTLDRVTDWDALGARWRDLEARAACSFFQSWTWIGCLAKERFDRPVLLEARQDGRSTALGLFNHRPGLLRDTLLLHETGDPKRDALFIEYNGLLVESGAAPELNTQCLTAALTWNAGDARRGLLGRRLVLSGIDDAQLHACGSVGQILRHLSRTVPILDLTALRRDGRLHLDLLSANTRAQLRRSLRRYEQAGPLRVERANDAVRAHAWLDALAALHQRTWQSRGRPGAFANPAFARFHHALIDTALPRGEVDLLRVLAGSGVIGYLYNFRHRDRVLAYQSGFDYAAADRHQKPGLTCHHLAIERSRAESQSAYDFLAGGDRYKRSLANGETTLHWVTIGARRRPA
jgi:CelD/BcsL family acetyltransferase involved in cellulose biosynthesis